MAFCVVKHGEQTLLILAGSTILYNAVHTFATLSLPVGQLKRISIVVALDHVVSFSGYIASQSSAYRGILHLSPSFKCLVLQAQVCDRITAGQYYYLIRNL